MPSIREQITVAIVDTLSNMSKPTYDVTFDVVQRVPFQRISAGKKYSAGVFDDSDLRSPDIDPVVRVTLKVAIEFIVYIEPNQDPTTELNKVLNDVEKALMVDRTLGGLAIDITVDRTEHDIEGRFDKYAESTMFLSIQYRHKNTDPSLPV